MLRTYVELVGVKREENYSGKMHLSSRAVLHRSKRKSTVVDNNSKKYHFTTLQLANKATYGLIFSAKTKLNKIRLLTNF